MPSIERIVFPLLILVPKTANTNTAATCRSGYRPRRRSVIAEFSKTPTPKLERIDRGFVIGQGGIRDEVVAGGRPFVSRLFIRIGCQIELALLHLLRLKIFVQRLDRLPSLQKRSLHASADNVPVHKIALIAVASAADNKHVLARRFPGFLQSMNNAAREAVTLCINPGYVIPLRRKDLRTDLIAFL